MSLISTAVCTDGSGVTTLTLVLISGDLVITSDIMDLSAAVLGLLLVVSLLLTGRTGLETRCGEG